MRYIPPLLFGASLGAFAVGLFLPADAMRYAEYVGIACAFACVISAPLLLFPMRWV